MGSAPHPASEKDSLQILKIWVQNESRRLGCEAREVVRARAMRTLRIELSPARRRQRAFVARGVAPA